METTESLQNVVTIDLSDSTYAHGFKIENRIHKQEFDHLMHLINKQLTSIAGEKGIDKKCDLQRQHNAISIFGERGTGKTSFIFSVFDELRTSHANDVEILGLIDPTIIEEKAHIFLLLISLINEKVKKTLEKGEVKPHSDAYIKRREWEHNLQALAKGLPSLENVGKDYRNSDWQDDEFIMQKGLDAIQSSYDLEKCFHSLVDSALSILNKKAFVVAFDDTDTSMEKGWRVLECIRRYITTPQIITILSGNMSLYNLIVRNEQWKQFGDRLLKNENGRDYGRLVSQLENQYMLKVFKAENRIHLYPISTIIKQQGIRFSIKGENEEEQKDLLDCYKQILRRYGIRSKSSSDIFTNYMLGLSIRTQINYLSINMREGESFSISNVEAFLSRMYAANINVDISFANPSSLNMYILSYLQNNSSKNDIRDAYLLMPISDDSETNACMVGLSLLFSNMQVSSPYLPIDYLIRIGFLRNLLWSDSNKENDEKIINYASFLHEASLKNIVGMSMAFRLGTNDKEAGMDAFSSLFGLRKNARREEPDKIDAVLEKCSDAQKVLGYLPLCSLNYTFKNESRLYYSLYSLLACIGMVSKESFGMTVYREEASDDQKDNVKNLLRDLSQLRFYPVPNGEKGEIDYQSEHDSLSLSNDDSLNLLSAELSKWLMQRDKGRKITPSFVLGRISTRLYASITKIKEANIGDYMYRVIMAFLNACLVEECKENLSYSELSNINLSNAVSSDKIFNDNASALKEIAHSHIGEKTEKYKEDLMNIIPFTLTMVKCPLIWAYLPKEMYDSLDWISKDIAGQESLLVYEVLKKISTKGEALPSFKRGKGSYLETYNWLKQKDFDLGYLESDAKELAEAINARDLFSKHVGEKPVQDFIDLVRSAKLEPFDDVPLDAGEY